MRISDFERKKPERLETREVNLTTSELVKELKMENSLAKEKIGKIPSQTKEELKPYFAESFWKEGNA